MKVLSFGEILWDIIEGKNYLGGAPFNFSAHMAQCGAKAYIISRLGKDELGKEAAEIASTYEVNTSLIQWDEKHPTGTVEVVLNEGQPDYTIHASVAYDFIDYAEVSSKLQGQEFDVFYFGSLAQRNHTSKNTLKSLLGKNTFDYVFYDVNLRKDSFNKEIIHDSLKLCNILKLNHSEVPVIAQLLYKADLSMEDFCTKMSIDYELELIIITAAEKGCYIFEADKLQLIPGKAVAVADAVGAGDSFSAAFMYNYFHKGDALTAAKVANQVGGFVASHHGAIPSYSEEIKSLLTLL